jgi:hypothetical protein
MYFRTLALTAPKKKPVFVKGQLKATYSGYAKLRALGEAEEDDDWQAKELEREPEENPEPEEEEQEPKEQTTDFDFDESALKKEIRELQTEWQTASQTGDQRAMGEIIDDAVRALWPFARMSASSSVKGFSHLDPSDATDYASQALQKWRKDTLEDPELFDFQHNPLGSITTYIKMDMMRVNRDTANRERILGGGEEGSKPVQLDQPTSGEEGEGAETGEHIPGATTTTGDILGQEKTARDIDAFRMLSAQLRKEGRNDEATLLDAMISEPGVKNEQLKAITGWSMQRINKLLPILQQEIRKRARRYQSINALMRGRVKGESILRLFESYPILRLLFPGLYTTPVRKNPMLGVYSRFERR